MNINEFFSNYKNHPILFIGTGFSLRYLNNSFTWPQLLQRCAEDLFDNERQYLNILSQCTKGKVVDLPKLAEILEEEFEKIPHDSMKFQELNDIFYEQMRSGNKISRLKIHISIILKKLEINEAHQHEINEIKNCAKNIATIVTTNYDELCEELFKFKTIVGNDVLLSSPYGSVYKIHGCVKAPEKIIITASDYKSFETKNELIRAQLLSLFINNPIIFIGYRVGDENIKKILGTIFSYVDSSSKEAEKIKSNFLLVERADQDHLEILEHDIEIQDGTTIRINKIRLNDYTHIYKNINSLELPVSAYEVRKVQKIYKKILSGGDIKVRIVDDLDSISSGDTILAIGSVQNIKFEFYDVNDLIFNYFNIIESKKSEILKSLEKLPTSKRNWLPASGFYKINPEIEKLIPLIPNQKSKIKLKYKNIPAAAKIKAYDIDKLVSSGRLGQTNISYCIIYNIEKGNINLDSLETYLKSFKEKTNNDYRFLLCYFDYYKFNNKSPLL